MQNLRFLFLCTSVTKILQKVYVSLFILKSLSLKYTFFSNQQVSISKKKDIFKCFHSVLDMGKTNKETQVKGRKKL